MAKTDELTWEGLLARLLGDEEFRMREDKITGGVHLVLTDPTASPRPSVAHVISRLDLQTSRVSPERLLLATFDTLVREMREFQGANKPPARLPG